MGLYKAQISKKEIYIGNKWNKNAYSGPVALEG